MSAFRNARGAVMTMHHGLGRKDRHHHHHHRHHRGSKIMATLLSKNKTLSPVTETNSVSSRSSCSELGGGRDDDDDDDDDSTKHSCGGKKNDDGDDVSEEQPMLQQTAGTASGAGGAGASSSSFSSSRSRKKDKQKQHHDDDDADDDDDDDADDDDEYDDEFDEFEEEEEEDRNHSRRGRSSRGHENQLTSIVTHPTLSTVYESDYDSDSSNYTSSEDEYEREDGDSDHHHDDDDDDDEKRREGKDRDSKHRSRRRHHHHRRRHHHHHDDDDDESDGDYDDDRNIYDSFTDGGDEPTVLTGSVNSAEELEEQENYGMFQRIIDMSCGWADPANVRCGRPATFHVALKKELKADTELASSLLKQSKDSSPQGALVLPTPAVLAAASPTGIAKPMDTIITSSGSNNGNSLSPESQEEKRYRDLDDGDGASSSPPNVLADKRVDDFENTAASRGSSARERELARIQYDKRRGDTDDSPGADQPIIPLKRPASHGHARQPPTRASASATALNNAAFAKELRNRSIRDRERTLKERKQKSTAVALGSGSPESSAASPSNNKDPLSPHDSIDDEELLQTPQASNRRLKLKTSGSIGSNRKQNSSSPSSGSSDGGSDGKNGRSKKPTSPRQRTSRRRRPTSGSHSSASSGEQHRKSRKSQKIHEVPDPSKKKKSSSGFWT